MLAHTGLFTKVKCYHGPHGRFQGPMQLGSSGSSQLWPPREEIIRPRPGTMGVAVKESLKVAAKALPHRSTAQVEAVSDIIGAAASSGTFTPLAAGRSTPWKGQGLPGGGSSGHALDVSRVFRRSAAYSFDRRPAMGTSTNSGSPK